MTAPDWYLQRCGTTGATLIARRPDGWILAECSRTDALLNGMHDGTDKGKAAYAALVEEHGRSVC